MQQHKSKDSNYHHLVTFHQEIKNIIHSLPPQGRRFHFKRDDYACSRRFEVRQNLGELRIVFLQTLVSLPEKRELHR